MAGRAVHVIPAGTPGGGGPYLRSFTEGGRGGETFVGSLDTAAVAYIRRDSDQFNDYALPTPVGIGATKYCYAQNPTNGTGTLLDPYNLLGTGGLRSNCAAGDEWQIWGDFPAGDAFYQNSHGTVSNHLWIRTKPGETMATIRGASGQNALQWNVSAYTYQWAEDIEFVGNKIASGQGSICCVMDGAQNCFLVDVLWGNSNGSGLRIYGVGHDNWFDGFEVHNVGSTSGNSGDGISISTNSLTASAEDNTFVRGHIHLCGHTAVDHGSYSGGIVQGYDDYRCTLAYLSVANPWSDGINYHDNWHECILEHAVIQDCGISPTIAASRITFNLYGTDNTYRHIRSRNIRREGGKTQADNFPGGYQASNNHTFHWTVDRTGREAFAVLYFTGGSANSFTKQNLVESCLFVNANVNEADTGGAGGNKGTTAFWSPLTVTAYDCTASQWTDANYFDSGAAAAENYVRRCAFIGITQEAVTGWTLDSGSIYWATMPNKFAVTQDPDSGYTETNLTQRTTYSDEMVQEGGVDGTRRTSKAAMVAARDFYYDQAAGRIYYWASDGSDPDTKQVTYGRNASSVRFFTFGPKSTEGSAAAYTLANAETGWTELSNNLHEIAVAFAPAGDQTYTRDAYTKSTAGYKGSNVSEWLRPDEAGGTDWQDAGSTTLGLTAIGITEFGVAALAGTGEPVAGYFDSGPDLGAWEIT